MKRTGDIEKSSRAKQARQQSLRQVKAIRLITVSGHGPCPGIDLDDTAALLEAMETSHGSY